MGTAFSRVRQGEPVVVKANLFQEATGIHVLQAIGEDLRGCGFDR